MSKSKSMWKFHQPELPSLLHDQFRFYEIATATYV